MKIREAVKKRPGCEWAPIAGLVLELVVSQILGNWGIPPEPPSPVTIVQCVAEVVYSCGDITQINK